MNSTADSLVRRRHPQDLHASQPVRLWRGVKAVGSAWSDDRCSQKAAALAYYTAFSIAPVLVLVLALAGLVVDSAVVSDAVLEEARRLFGKPGAEMVGQLLMASARDDARGVSVAIAAAALLLGATNAFAELKDSLDDIWKVYPSETLGWWSLVRARLLSLGLLAALVFLLLVSLVMNAALALLWSVIGGWLGDAAGAAVAVGAELVSLLVIGGLFAAIYKLLPEVGLRWSEVVKGAAITTVLFAFGKWAIGLYLGNSAPASAFGAAGSLAVVLLWVYYSASIFFLGAEVTRLFVMHRREIPERVDSLP